MKKPMLSAFLVLTVLKTQACPLGAGESQLTIHRVMINFGRYTMNADSTARKGTQPRESVGDADLVQASRDLGVALSCADAVLQNPRGDLLPDRARNLKGAEQDQYLRDFLTTMDRFRSVLSDYRDLFGRLLQTPSSQRDFRPLLQKSRELAEVASDAHSHL